MSFLIRKLLDYFNLTTCQKELWTEDDSEKLEKENILPVETISENEAENELNKDSKLPVIEEDFYNKGLKFDQTEIQEFKLNKIHTELPKANESLEFQNPNCGITFTTENVNSDKEVYENEDKTNALEDIVQLSEKTPSDSEESAVSDSGKLVAPINDEMPNIKDDSVQEHNLVEDSDISPNIRILDLDCLKDYDYMSVPPWMHWRNQEDSITGERSDTSEVDCNLSLEMDVKEKSSDSLNDIGLNGSISCKKSQSASNCMEPKFPSPRNLPPIVPIFQRRNAHSNASQSIVQPISNYFSHHHPQKQNDEFSEVKIKDSFHQDDHKQNLDSSALNFFHQNSTHKENNSFFETEDSFKITKHNSLNQNSNINEYDNKLCTETTIRPGHFFQGSPQNPEIVSLTKSEKCIIREKEDIPRGIPTNLQNTCINGRRMSLVSSSNKQSLPSLEVMRKEDTNELSLQEGNKNIDASYIFNFAAKNKVYQNKSKKRSESLAISGTRVENKDDWIPEKKEKTLPNLMPEKDLGINASHNKIKKPGKKTRFISMHSRGKQRVPFINKF